MALKNTEDNYGRMSKSLHWLVSILVIALLIVGAVMGDIPVKPLKGLVYTLHKLTGLIIFFLMIFFAIWSAFNTKPKYPEAMKAWELWLAKFVRISLYSFVIAMPLVGWIFSTAAGHPPSLFGIAELPAPFVPASKTLVSIGKELHEIIAWIILCLIVVHTAGAFTHRIIYRDNVLQRMMGRGQKQENTNNN